MTNVLNNYLRKGEGVRPPWEIPQNLFIFLFNPSLTYTSISIVRVKFKPWQEEIIQPLCYYINYNIITTPAHALYSLITGVRLIIFEQGLTPARLSHTLQTCSFWLFTLCAFLEYKITSVIQVPHYLTHIFNSCSWTLFSP